MSRTLSGPMVAHMAQPAHTRARMLRLDLLDGSSIGITTHDRPILFDLGDGAIVYSPETGIMPGAVSLSIGFDTDNYEVSGPIADTVTLDAILGRRFNRARARLFEVNWKSLTAGAIKLMAGNVGEARIEGGKFVLAIRNDLDRYNQTVGRILTPMCDADLGDARCTASFVSVDAVVTAATDAMRFTVSFTGAYADGFFNAGKVVFTSGALAGTPAMEIHDWSAGGAIVTFMSLADVPAIGDTLSVRQGCPKTRTACRDTFGNAINFRGFPEVPGSDQVLKSQVPGDASA
jgi:uncharacterized phage protein (TIGR02218 family)